MPVSKTQLKCSSGVFLFSTQNVLNTINLLSWPTDMPTLLSFPTSMKPWIPKTRSKRPARHTHKVWQRHTEALTGKNISSLVWQDLINTHTHTHTISWGLFVVSSPRDGCQTVWTFFRCLALLWMACSVLFLAKHTSSRSWSNWLSHRTL